MGYIVMPQGSTDPSQGTFHAEGTPPQSIAATGPRDLYYKVASGDAGIAASATASRLSTSDARFGGGHLGGKTAATIVFDGINIPDDPATGTFFLFEWISSAFDGRMDLRSTKRDLSFSISNVSGLIFAGYQYANGALPAGRQNQLVVSASCDDGTGNARLSAWVNGISVLDASAPGTGTFEANRALDLFAPGYAIDGIERVRVFGGTHAQGYTSDGSVAGLTLIDPAADMTASQFNTGTPYFTKTGVDDWAIG